MSALPGYDFWKTTDFDGERRDAEAEAIAEISDMQISDWLYTEGLDAPLLEAAIYAWRNGDHLYMVRQFDRLAMPVIERERES